MIDIEKMRSEAQERIELRQKFNRALVLEEDERTSNKEQNKEVTYQVAQVKIC